MYIVLIQDRTDYSLQGRVFAFETFLTYLSVPLATALGGVLIEKFGIMQIYGLFSILGVIISLVFIKFSNWKEFKSKISQEDSSLSQLVSSMNNY